MKQIIIRQFPNLLTVHDFVFGEIVDGQFTQLDLSECPFIVPDYVHRSNLLGTAAFIETKDIFRFVRDYFPYVSDFTPYPNFLVYTLHESPYDSQKDQEI